MAPPGISERGTRGLKERRLKIPGRSSRWAHAIPLGLWPVLAALVVYRFAGRATDDIYITFRYAQNLAQGQGFVFNPGERVFGVTDPGVGLAIGLAHAVTRIPIPVLGTIATALALLGTAALLLREGRERGRLGEALVGGTLLLTSAYVWAAQGAGPIFALLLLVAAARAGRDRPRLAGLVAGLAVWCRPDAALGAGWLGLLAWRERRRLPWAYALVLAATVLAGCAVAWWYFGDVVPNTLVAKRQFAALDPATTTGFKVFWGRALDLFRLRAGPLAVMLLVLGAAGQWLLYRSSGPAGRLLVLHSAGLAVAYTLLEVPFFVWYTVPTAVALLYGFAFCGGAVLRRLAGARGRRRWLARTAAAGSAAVSALVVASFLLGSARWFEERGAGDWRLPAYTRTGEWIRRHSRPADDIAFVEIGILAFHSRRPVHDLIGLVTPRSLPYVAAGDFAGAFLAKPTEFVLFHTFTRRGGTRPIVSQPWFGQAYEEAVRFELPELGGSITVFRRRPGSVLPPPPRVPG